MFVLSKRTIVVVKAWNHSTSQLGLTRCTVTENLNSNIMHVNQEWQDETMNQYFQPHQYESERYLR